MLVDMGKHWQAANETGVTHMHDVCADCLARVTLTCWILGFITLAVTIWAVACVGIFWDRPIVVMAQRKYLAAILGCTFFFVTANILWIEEYDSHVGATFICWIRPLLQFPSLMALIALLTVKEYRVLRLIRATAKLQRATNNDRLLLVYVGAAIAVPIIVVLTVNSIFKPQMHEWWSSGDDAHILYTTCVSTFGDVENSNRVNSVVLDSLALIQSFFLLYISFRARKIPTVVGESKYMFGFCILGVVLLFVRWGVTISSLFAGDEETVHWGVSAVLQQVAVLVLVIVLLSILVFRKVIYLDTSADDLRKTLIDSTSVTAKSSSWQASDESTRQDAAYSDFPSSARSQGESTGLLD